MTGTQDLKDLQLRSIEIIKSMGKNALGILHQVNDPNG